MKKTMLFLSMLSLIFTTKAQKSDQVFGSPTIVWYGVDFTMAKLVGFGDESPHKIQEQYFKPWNDVAIDIDISKVFHKQISYKDPNGIIKDDLARETSNLKSDNAPDLTPEAIAARVKAIPQGHKTQGLAVVFIVQSFDAGTKDATVQVVYFDIKTRDVLWSKKVSAKAGGGNTEKAWTAALKNIFNDIEKKYYKDWKIEAGY